MKARYWWALMLLLVTPAAWAAPVIIIAAQYLAATAVISATTAALISIAVAAYGAVEARQSARRAAAKARADYNASLSDRTVTMLQADPAHRVTYGRCITGGSVVAMFTSDKQGTRTNGAAYTKPDGYKHLVVVFASHRCKALNEVYIDGQAVGIAALDAGGWATTGEFGGTQDVHREVLIAPGGAATFPAAVSVQAFLEAYPGGDNMPQDGVYVLSNGDKTITNSSAFTCAVSLTYTLWAGSVRVSWFLGTDTQAADAYLRSVLPTRWLATDQLKGRAGCVITLDLENTRFQSGPPGMTFDVSGRDEIYDPRKNLLPNPRLQGAVAGVPGTLPTGTFFAVPAGLSASVVGSGIDVGTGHFYLDMRVQGVPTATGSGFTLTLASASMAPAAAPGQAWGGRIGVVLRSMTGAHPLVRAQLMTFDAVGTGTVEASGSSVTVAAGPLQWAEVADAALGASALKASLRLQMTVTVGVDYDTSFRLILPQLFMGVAGGVADPTGWSDNPALITRDWLRAWWGYGVAEDDIDDVDLGVAANACDAAIQFTVDGTSKIEALYTCNGSFTTDESKEGVLDGLCQSMAGFAVPGAAWSIQAGAWAPPVMVLTDDDLHGQVEIVQAGAGMDQIFNGIRGSYLPAGASAPVDALYANAVFRAADGQALWVDMQFPWTNNAARVKNLQRVQVERNRAGMVVNYPAKLKAWPLRPGDRVEVVNGEYAWSSKTFRVTDWNFGVNQAVMLTLQEDVASIYDQADAAVADPTPNTGLPNPWKVAGITGAAAESGDTQLQVLEDGTLNIRCRVSWAALTDAYVIDGGFVEMAWRRVGIDPENQWTLIASGGDATSEWIGGLVDGHTVTIGLTAVNSLGVRGKTTYLSHKVIGKRLPPSDVQSVGFAAERFGIRLYWPAVTDRDVIGYPLRINGTSWETATPVTQVAGVEYLLGVTDYGSFPVWVKAIDTGGRLSTHAATAVVTINAPAAPVVSYQVLGTDEELSWTFVAGNFALDHFDIRMGGADWASAAPVTSTKATSYRRRVDYGGAKRYWVAAVDAAGTVGTATAIDVNIVVPGSINGGRSEVIDNNALLYWLVPTTGSLPVDRYEARKGATWATGTPIGSNGNSTFTAIFEQQSGTYSYWIAAWDTAGNMGSPVAIVATINQPPDYVLRVNIDSTFTGTLTKMVAEGGTLMGPVSTAQTVDSHFASRGWTSPADQVGAGYPLYLEPSTTAGSYSETFDYGAVLAATTVTATLGSTVIDGAVAVACQIYYKAAAGDAWTVATAGATSVLISDFRYVKVTWTFTCTAGANLIRIESFNLKLANKLKTDSGVFTITDANAGTVVPFAVSFVDADTPICQANGGAPLIPVVNFTDAPNPTGFTVYLYNTSGAKVIGSGSWTARGY